MRLSEIKGETALEVIADIIEPAFSIMSDKEFEKAIKADKKYSAIQIALKKHKKDVLTILAVLDGEDPETYKPSLLSIPKKLLEMLSDPELMELFQSQGQTSDAPSAGSASEITEE